MIISVDHPASGSMLLQSDGTYPVQLERIQPSGSFWMNADCVGFGDLRQGEL